MHCVVSSNAVSWITFAPIADEIELFYGVSPFLGTAPGRVAAKCVRPLSLTRILQWCRGVGVLLNQSTP